jgi:hypothetical protein
MPPPTTFDPINGLIGGVLIGLSAVYLMYFSGLIAGISGMVRRLVTPWGAEGLPPSAAFLVGLAFSPSLYAVTTRQFAEQSIPESGVLAIVAGLLVGFGTVYAGGCTSGHGICGLARFSKRSLAAVATFMLAGMITVYVARYVVGS